MYSLISSDKYRDLETPPQHFIISRSSLILLTHHPLLSTVIIYMLLPFLKFHINGIIESRFLFVFHSAKCFWDLYITLHQPVIPFFFINELVFHCVYIVYTTTYPFSFQQTFRLFPIGGYYEYSRQVYRWAIFISLG